MLQKLKDFFDQQLQAEAAESERALEHLTAALLLQLARVDHSQDASEEQVIEQFIQTTFHLTSAEVQEIMALAEASVTESTSLYEFTSAIHERCSPEEKFGIILNMWKVAYADGHLDKYEEHFIRRAADLLYVPHPEFMRAKHLAKENRE